MCVSIFSTDLSETFLSLKRTERDIIIINVHMSSGKVFLPDFNQTFFYFRKILKHQNHENPDRTDGRTERQDEVSSTFSQFYKLAQK